MIYASRLTKDTLLAWILPACGEIKRLFIYPGRIMSCVVEGNDYSSFSSLILELGKSKVCVLFYLFYLNDLEAFLTDQNIRCLDLVNTNILNILELICDISR